MTQEEKELVIKDLCGRLPYGVIVQVNDGLKGIYDRRLVQVFCDRVSCSVNVCNPLKECICIDSVKPYLRPMRSMTKEEREKYIRMLCKVGFTEFHKTADKILDFLYKRHFDVHGFIPKGMAIEVTPENNPYKV